MLLVSVKNVAIFFGLACLAFCVATIVLAVEKSNLKEELQDARHKLETISSLITPTPVTSTSSTTLTTTEQTSSTLPSNSTVTSPTTEFPWPTMTVPSSGPTFPTLPTGLPDPEKIIYRLPTEIRPIKYKVYIRPDFEKKTSEGSVSIQIEIDKETNLIVLHAKNLKIHSMSILNMMARMRIRIKKFYLDAEREIFFVELHEILFTATPYVVSLSYSCQMDGLQGFYLSSYSGADNKDR